MRLVVTSDWHGDWMTDGYERFGDLEEAIKPILKLMDDPDSRFIFLGDLSNPYSRNVHRAVQLAVTTAMSLRNNEDRESYWLVGNHDVVEDATGSHSLMALTPIATVLDQPCLRRIHDSSVVGRQDVQIIALPFTSPKSNYDPEQVIRDYHKALKEWKGPVIIAGHLNIEGISAGSETTDMARGRDVFWPQKVIEELFPNALLMNGHYHEQQVFRGIHIPGSLLRLTHGEEENNPGFMVFDI